VAFLSPIALILAVKEGTIFSMEVSMAANARAPLLSAFSFLLSIGCPIEAVGRVTGPPSPVIFLLVEGEPEVVPPFATLNLLKAMQEGKSLALLLKLVEAECVEHFTNSQIHSMNFTSSSPMRSLGRRAGAAAASGIWIGG
jgi:hypothetical protein